MKITGLHINNFGKLSDLTLKFSNGINLVSGENESGKTTLHTFMSAMLFGMERSKGRAARDDTYSHYLPWNGGAFGGVMEVAHDTKDYSISRNFDRETRGCILTDETASANLEPTPETMSRILSGLTPSLYSNTLSISQLSASPGSDLADELRNHIVNLRTAGSASLDVTKAVNRLNLQRKYMSSSYSKDAESEAKDLRIRINAIEQELAEGAASPQISRLENEKSVIERKVLRAENQQQQLNALIQESEQSLRARNLETPEDVDLIREDVDALEEDYLAYTDRHKARIHGFGRFLLILLVILLAGGFGFCGYKIGLHISSGQLTSAYPYIGGAAAGIVLIILLIRRLLAASDFNGVCEDLSDIYADFIGEPPRKLMPEHIEEIKQHLAGYIKLFATIEDGRDNLERTRGAVAAAMDDMNRISAQLEAARKESWKVEQKEEALWAMQERLSMLSGTLESNARIQEETEAIKLAISTMQGLSTEVFESFGHFLQETSSQLIRSITGGSYSGIFIDNDMSISLECGMNRIPLNRVSSGTIDQVYLSVRLACIEFLWPEENMPLFLDDTFALYDNDRLTETLKWLAENYGGQIFLFSCHTREASILDNLKIPYNNISL